MLSIGRIVFCRRTIVFLPLLSGALIWVLSCPAAADDLLRTAEDLQAKYVADIQRLAAECDEQGLKEEARKTRAVLGPRDPTKIFVPMLPREVGPPPLAGDATAEAVQWNQRFNQLRRDHSAALYDLARRAVRSRRAALAVDLVLEAARANPDNENVRRVLGYQKYRDQWRTHYDVKKLRAGLVWSERFGWLPKSHVKRYEDGQRYRDGKWISADEDARRHQDIRSGWDVTTEHYRIRTNHSLEAGVALGEKLERLYRLWQQMFLRFYASQADVIAWFDGRTRTPRRRALRHDVVYFRDRDDYNRTLGATVPNIEISIGFYRQATREAYFFADPEDGDRTLYHEATHQLFHESRPVAPNVAAAANFWIVEGIAMYMETLKMRDGFFVLGGFDDQRMRAARYRLLEDKFYVPLADFCGYGMEKLQKDPKIIGTLYSQAAGLTQFLIHYDHGRYRDALVSYLVAVYTGRDSPSTLSELTGVPYGTLDQQYREFIEGGGVSGESTKDAK